MGMENQAEQTNQDRELELYREQLERDVEEQRQKREMGSKQFHANLVAINVGKLHGDDLLFGMSVESGEVSPEQFRLREASVHPREISRYNFYQILAQRQTVVQNRRRRK
ncbi:hypothetical protein HY405_01875 [Candidatus Microgenomates bacterium]|nr:hypothetical protein [Candidatus Microgenomates bacterium]